MSELSDKLAYTEQPQYGYITNEPGVVDNTFSTIMGLASLGQLGKIKSLLGGWYNNGLNLYNSGLGLYNEYKPFFNDIKNGKDLFISSIFGNNHEIRKTGNEYLKNNLVNNPISTNFGTIEFRNKLVNETDPKHLWQLPFTRINLYKAQKNTKIPNKKPEQKPDVDYFDNIEVDLFGNKYDYQVRNNKNDKSKDLYNIKKYQLLEKDLEEIKEKPELYQKFIELNNKGL